MTYCLLTRRHLNTLWQRFGFFTPPLHWKFQKRLWFHAASVGEVQVAKALISALRRKGIRADIIITTVTLQGHLTATKHLADMAFCIYAPVDVPSVVERFISKLRPTVYICLETELWPNVLRLMQQNSIKTLLLNGRVSENAFNKYSKIPGFIRQVLHCFNSASLIQEIDRHRYLALGLEPEKIQVNGNAKYDQPLESFVPFNTNNEGNADQIRKSVTRHYQGLLGLKHDQQILIAGSTHSGEESIILEAFTTLTATIPELILIVAPRHINRLDQIMADWRRRGIDFERLSQPRPQELRAQVILVDQMGELASLYSIGTYVFCGGSLVNRGGHNIMEPAFWGKPPFFGPYMNDFNDARVMLEKQGGGFLVNNTEELISKIMYFHSHQDSYQEAAQRALTVAEAQQGAADRQADLIRQALNY